MPDKNIISRVVDWLSVGYPKDVPVQDRAAVMAILKMRLTDEQLQEVVRRLMQSRAARGEAYVSDQRINEYIRRVVDHTPTPQDIDRVAKAIIKTCLNYPLRHVKRRVHNVSFRIV